MEKEVDNNQDLTELKTQDLENQTENILEVNSEFDNKNTETLKEDLIEEVVNDEPVQETNEVHIQEVKVGNETNKNENSGKNIQKIIEIQVEEVVDEQKTQQVPSNNTNTNKNDIFLTKNYEAEKQEQKVNNTQAHQTSKNIDIENSSFNIQNQNVNKKTANFSYEFVPSNVHNFSVIPTQNLNNKNNDSTKQVNSTSSANNFSNNQIKNENKFNLINNPTTPSLNQNPNADAYNNYKMSSMINMNMGNGMNQQGVYPMPMVYYPPNSANPETNYNYPNFMPYMSYPMGYYVNPQTNLQQAQGNLKENDVQNKNRKMNNYVNKINIFFIFNLKNLFFLGI